MRLQTVSGGAESPESVRQRSNLAELIAYAQCHDRNSLHSSVLILTERAPARGLDSSLMVLRPRPKRDDRRDQRLAPLGQRIVNSRRDRRI